MGWGIGWGLLIIGLIGALFAYVILKETRTHLFWRQKVEEGDLEMIRQLVLAEVEHWRTEAPPSPPNGSPGSPPVTGRFPRPGLRPASPYASAFPSGCPDRATESFARTR